MTFEIRTITSDEIEQAQLISMEAFASADRFDPAQGVEQARRFYQPDWHLCAFEDGEMTSMMRMLPFAMRLNGRAIPFAGIGPVANSPLHRRKGHTGAILRRSLELMRERGQWLAGLYTPHPAFYRRYGWEIASESRIYTFKPKDYRAQVQPSQRGRLRAIKPADWQQLDPVYRRYALHRNGPLHRGEIWWRNACLGEAQPQPFEAVLWQTDDGEAEGYLVFQQPNQGPNAGKVMAREFVALGGDAYLNLLAFLAGHDIASEVSLRTSVEDRLMNVFADTERLQVRQGYEVLLRIVDFEGAMNARAAAREDDKCELVLEIDDPPAPWNSGRWSIGVAGGRSWAQRSESEPELRLSSQALAPVFNGYLSPSSGAASGLIWCAGPDALERAGRIFAVQHQPYFTDSF